MVIKFEIDSKGEFCIFVRIVSAYDFFLRWVPMSI